MRNAWKKICLLLSLLVVVWGMTACQKPEDSNETSAEPSTQEVTEPETTEPETTEPETSEPETMEEEILEPLDTISLAELDEMSGEECLQMLKRVGYELPELDGDKIGPDEIEMLVDILYQQPCAYGAYGREALHRGHRELHEVFPEYDPEYPGAYGPEDPGFTLNLEEMVNLSGAECFEKLQPAGYALPELDMAQEDLEGMLEEVIIELYHDPSEYGTFGWTELELMKKKLHKMFLAYDPNYPDAYGK